MTRQYSTVASNSAKRLLRRLVDKATCPQEYRTAMTKLGCQLGNAMLNVIGTSGQSAYLVATAEDADFLAQGVLQALEPRLASVGFSCIWNERESLYGLQSLDVAPILKQYKEPVGKVDYLIVVKSIISDSCVVRTNLQNLIQTLQPREILIAAPVIHARAEASLRQVFPQDISDKFHFFYFAEDDERTASGEVLPGIGGMVFERLGFSGQASRYIPEIVQERRRSIVKRRKTKAS